MFQCSWVRRLHVDSFHEWKVIPLKLIKKSFGSHFKFHSNLLSNISCTNDFPSFYLDIFCNWINPGTPLCILSQYLWFNKFIIVNVSYVNFANFLTNNISFANENCNFKSCETLKNEYHLDKKLYFQKYCQKYFGKVFSNENFDWKKIYILPRVVTIKSFQCNFQYKILHNM